MKPQYIKETLLERTIAVIAEQGLDKTTTKAIVAGTGINEGYIYRYFADKEDLLAKAFDVLDNELKDKATELLPIMAREDLSQEEKWYAFFCGMWTFLLAKRDRCLAFVQYYYSPYFVKHSYEAHVVRYRHLTEGFSKVCIEEADVWMILNHILIVMLDFAVKVHHHQMSESDPYAEHVFRVIYVAVKQYFKEP